MDEFRKLALCGSTLNCVPGRLRYSLDKLLQASLAPSSRAHYQPAWKKLVSLGLPTRLPVSVPLMLLFIAHLYANGSAPASIVSTVSAVAYFHKINGFHDPSNCFMVSKLLAGARNLGTVPDVRLPVTLPVLSLVDALPTVFASRYKCLMLRAMMVLAFKAYLRIGKMVPRSRGTIRGCLHMDDVLYPGS